MTGSNTDNFMKINFDEVKQAIKSGSAFKQVTRLVPAGGNIDKIFPPTYVEGKEGGKYAWEKRRLNNGTTVDTVLLDSVQSQANRMEAALLEAVENGHINLSLLKVDFSDHFNDIGKISTLETPHRIADAIFRESTLDGKEFRKTEIGKAFIKSNIRDAIGLFQYCPHALTFGQWDSTGPTGMGNKFQRTIVSEIVGINAQAGVQTASRIDPVLHSNPTIYETAAGGWTPDAEDAKKEKDKPKKYQKKVSELNLGNVPPSIKQLGGGVTIDYALQTIVISPPAIRRLHFPVDGRESPEMNISGQAVILALGIAAMSHARDQGYDLRSRCLLLPEGDSPLELLNTDSSTKKFHLDSAGADQILNQAIDNAKNCGLPWMDKDIILKPNSDLVKLVKKSKDILANGQPEDTLSGTA